MAVLITYCDWCWQWDRLYIPDWVDGALCPECLDHGMANDWRPPWDSCYWCWRWGWLDFSLRRVGVVDGALCDDCMAHGLANDWAPPWQPDARARLTELLGPLGWPVDVVAHIVELVHSRSEP